MIDVKQAVVIAKQKAAEVFGEAGSNLEEMERDTYKDRDVWSITLSLPRDLSLIPPLRQITADPLQYKKFLIDVETGELLAMKVREFAAR